MTDTKPDLGTVENPITEEHPDVPRAHKFCKCSECDIVRQCTLNFDYYVVPDGSLLCERCLRSGIVGTRGGPDPTLN